MTKVLAIGDIHCKTWIIDSVEAVVDKYDAVVFVGDYADNWNADAMESINTWEKLYSLQSKNENVHLVCGNHDYIYCHNTPTLQSGFNEGTQKLLNLNPPLKGWLADLPVVLEIDGVLYSHAGVDERWNGDTSIARLWNDTSPIWVRPDNRTRYKKVPQVFGHTPQYTCTEIEPNIWAIDTFSQYPSLQHIGDGSVLEIIDGKEFYKIPWTNILGPYTD